MDLSTLIPELLWALPMTLGITFAAILAGFCLALTATSLRVHRVPGISHLVDIYVSYGRSVPVVLQLFVAFYGLPVFLALFGMGDIVSPTAAAILGLSLYHGAYVSEVTRPAYLAVESGQHDAADSLGYTFSQKIRRVISPQAVHIALPGYGNALIYLVHNVALVMYIGAVDVMAIAHVVMERSFNQYQFQTYLVLAVLYSLLALVAWMIVRYFERRMSKYTDKSTPVAAVPSMVGAA